MKKLVLIVFASCMSLGVLAYSFNVSKTKENQEIVSEKTETITISAYNGNKELVDVEVPYNPQRIAILDLASLDILDTLGVGDRVVGVADTSIDYLERYSNNQDIVNLGTIKEADMEAVMECEPDVIFIGGRLSTSYDTLKEIAPVVFLQTDSEIGLVESVKNNTRTIASMFGLEEEVEEKFEGLDTRIEALSKIGKDTSALVGMVTSGSFNLLGNDGRCSIIGNELGFMNLTGDTGSGRPQSSSSTHGNESSFEVVVEKNPDYIFVLDRDSAIGVEGAQLAKDVMDNELIHWTSAYEKNQIVYLEHPAIWYTAEGGITALDVMLKDLESALLK